MVQSGAETETTDLFLPLSLFYLVQNLEGCLFRFDAKRLKGPNRPIFHLIEFLELFLESEGTAQKSKNRDGAL